MSETNEQEVRDAAAIGAAAAVDAVTAQQHDDEQQEAVVQAAEMASGAATVAEEQAGMAAEVATEASAVASEAHTEAVQAEVAAEQATEAATEAQSGVENLRDFMSAGFTELRKFITDSLAPKEPTDKPTEVVVTHGASGQDSKQEGSDTGSSGSAESSGDRPYRHRFGRRGRG